MTTPQIELRIEDQTLVVEGGSELHDRRTRRLFGTILGGIRTSTGWRIAARDQPIDVLTVRVDNYLRERQWQIVLDEHATREIQLISARQRSFERTREAATSWKAGETTISEIDFVEMLDVFGWSADRPLRLHQLRDATHGLIAGNAANFSVPGSGKTMSALAVAVSHMSAGTVEAILVVGPLACFEPWENETTAALGDNLTVQRIRGSVDQRATQYASVGSRTVLLIGYQTAATDQQRLFDLADRLDLMLIVDESHRAKRFRGGSWAPALIEIAKHCKTRMILSGTPMPRSPLDLYSQLMILWPDGHLTGTADDYALRAEGDFPGLRRQIAPFTTRTSKEELGLPSCEIHYHEVELQGTQAEIYDLIAAGFRRQIADAENWQEKLETLRRARPIRLLQAATNADLLNHRDDFFDTPPLRTDSTTLMDRLARIALSDTPAKYSVAAQLIDEIASAGRKIVCWSNFIGSLDQWNSFIQRELGIQTFQIDGRVPVSDGLKDARDDDLDETRETILQNFLHFDGPAVFIANPASCSESISLHYACHDAIYLDRTYDAALYLQSLDRIHRLGLSPDASVHVHLIMATIDGQPTIDHLVDMSLNRKRADMERVLEGAELHPTTSALTRPEGVDDDLTELIRYLLGEESH